MPNESELDMYFPECIDKSKLRFVCIVKDTCMFCIMTGPLTKGYFRSILSNKIKIL